jgi:3-deoxy-manno-octulosonate cytidylyltransferase (CMP-KDO synthetase)
MDGRFPQRRKDERKNRPVNRVHRPELFLKLTHLISTRFIRFCRLNIDTRYYVKLICCPVNQTGANPQTNAVAIIPARFASSRLPGKPLLEIAGKPMICWVVERALAARNVGRVIVATDDARVLEAVSSAGYEAVMTRGSHASGTDRLAEVALSLTDFEIIVNVQGDEPLIAPDTIDRAIEALLANDDCPLATTWEPMTSLAEVLNPDVVKVVLDDSGHALYFSRAPVPYPRDAVHRHGSIEAALENEPALLTQFRKHTGLYVYRYEFLLEFARWPQTTLERAEALEQLRAVEHGVKIAVVQAGSPSIGVDTAEDLERVRASVMNGGFEFPVSSLRETIPSPNANSQLATRNSKLICL